MENEEEMRSVGDRQMGNGDQLTRRQALNVMEG